MTQNTTYISLWLRTGDSLMIDISEQYNLMYVNFSEELVLKFAFGDYHLHINPTEIQGWTISSPESREASRNYTRLIQSEEPFE